MMKYVWVMIAAMSVLGGVYTYGHHVGYAERDQEMQAQIAKMNEQARAEEQALHKQLTAKAAELRKANNDLDKKQADIASRIDSGRLQFPSSCVQDTASAGPTAGDRATDGGESNRQALKDIVAIAADGDRAIKKLNACIDTYNEVKDAVNGQR